MSDLDHDGTAQVTALSYTKKGDDILAVTIKIETAVSVTVMAGRIGADPGVSWLYDALWDHGPDAVNPRYWGIQDITSNTSDAGVTVQLGGLRLTNCRLDGWSFRPAAGGVAEASVKIHMENPPKQALETLPALLRTETKCKMTQPQADLPLGSAGNISPFRPGHSPQE